LVETIMGWPGLGPLFLEAIGARDFYLVIGPVLLSAAFLAFGTLLGDILLYIVDPRIRIES
jgi:peptide/nickel transport system permease protein